MFKMKSILKQMEKELNENKFVTNSEVISVYRFKGQMKLRWENIDYFGVESYHFIVPLVKLKKKNDGVWYVNTANYEGIEKLKKENIDYNNPFGS